MKLTDITYREKLKKKINQKIAKLTLEIDMMEQRKLLSDYDWARTTIGNACAQCEDLEESVKEDIFNTLAYSYEDQVIISSREQIKGLREKLRKQLKGIY